MIIYFADRNLNILGNASTSLPGGYRISNDATTENLESGVNIFSCEISYDENSRFELEEMAVEGMYILKSRGSAFDDFENIYDSLFQIVEIEKDTKNQTIYIYAEDAGLDLINTVSPAITLTDMTCESMLNYFVPNDWELNFINVPTETKTYTWDGENTLTERIKSIVGIFDCEVYYSFEIEQFQVTSKIINVTHRRGVQEANVQLRLDKHIDKIVTKSSMANLATAFSVTGGIPEGSDVPINLIGYSYSYHDYEKDDDYVVDTVTGQMRCTTQMENWVSALDADGLIVKSFMFDTTDEAILAGQARAELQKRVYPEVNYDIDFTELPDDARIGDRIIIIDEDGELYLEARILTLETSVSNNTRKATVGEYLLRKSDISEKVQTIADEMQKYGKSISGTSIAIASSGGNIFNNTPIATQLSATVFYGTTAINTVTKLLEVFGSNAVLKWYLNDEVVFTGFGPHNVSSPNDAIKYVVRLEA